MPANTCKVTDLQFLISVLNHSGTSLQTDFGEVAKECGMPSAGAASQKLSRIKKASEKDEGGAPATPKAAGNKGGKKTTGSTKKRKRSDEVDDREVPEEQEIKAEAGEGANELA